MGEIPIESPSIASVCYAEKDLTLQVRLKDGRIYRYRGVPREACHGLIKGTIHTDRLHSNIASKFEASEIHPEGAAKTERVRIQNFRSILDMTVRLDDLTVLLGANSTGKTTALEALGLFESEEADVSYHDIGRGLDETNITLSLKIHGSGVPGRFLTNGMIELRRTFTRANDKPRTTAAVMLNTDFDGIRNAVNDTKRAREIKKVNEKYPDFPGLTNTKGWKAEFAEYEHRLSLDPKYRTEYAKRFISFSRDEIDLSKILEVVMVPATRDIVADAGEGDGSNLSKLMYLSVQGSERRLREIRKLVMTTDEASKNTKLFREVVLDLERRLKRNSERYMEGAEFSVGLVLPGHSSDVLRALVTMKDAEFMEAMVRAGSGAQRAYLFTLIDTIAELTREVRERDPKQAGHSPVRLIAIDEPELHQHPQRQRQILQSLVDMAGDPSVRIVCSTHSPHFVRLKRADTLQIFRRDKKRIWSATREQLVGLMRPGRSPVADRWRETSRWLGMSATRWAADGFFAKRVVIVEGAGDRNMLLATARVLGFDLDRQGITVVPVGGVNNIEGFVHLFRTFGIPTYTIWDVDRVNSHKRNQRLTDVAGGKALEGSLDRTTINKNFACIEGDMTEALLTELYDCADILHENPRYVELEKARRDDEKGSKRKSCGGNASKKPVRRAQKGFLNDRLNVVDLLEAVGKRDRKRLGSFTTAKIVRALQGTAEPC